MRLHSLLLLLVMLFAVAAGLVVTAAPPAASPEQFKNNLEFLNTEVLPPDWKLNAVLKWDAYGHGIATLAGVAAGLNMSVSVLENSEAAAAAAVTPKPTIIRIKPANYTELVEAIKQGYGLQELASPINIDDLIRAANNTQTSIPIHLYMYTHYGRPWGWNFTTSQELQNFVKSLDPRYVTVKGIMTHVSGLQLQETPSKVEQFLQVTCPVAAALPTSPIAIHWVASEEAIRLIPTGALRMQPVIPAACINPKIEFMARFGTLIYGDYNENNIDKMLSGTAPVFRWTAPVKGITQKKINGVVRNIAQVGLSPSRYPHPTWWANNTAYNGAVLAEQYVFINKEAFPISSIEDGGSSIMIDVTDYDIQPKAGDEVCLICEDQPLGDLADVFGADTYNIALCLSGKQPVEGTQYATPVCAAGGSKPFQAPAAVAYDTQGLLNAESSIDASPLPGWIYDNGTRSGADGVTQSSSLVMLMLCGVAALLGFLLM